MKKASSGAWSSRNLTQLTSGPTLSAPPSAYNLQGWDLARVAGVDSKGAPFLYVERSPGSWAIERVSAAYFPDSVLELYRRVLGREGEASGLTYWMNTVAAGQVRLGQIEASFRATPEYQQRGGAPSEAIVALYRTLLGRYPETEGVVYWSNQLAQGVPLTALAQAIRASPEFTQGNGTFYPEPVVELYRRVLGREPEPGGLNYWVNTIAAGQVRLGQIEASFRATSEYQQRGGAPSEAIVALYRTLLGRYPETEGVVYWSGRLAAGTPLTVLAQAIRASPEYQTAVNPPLSRVRAYVSHTRLGTVQYLIGPRSDTNRLVAYWYSSDYLGGWHKNLWGILPAALSNPSYFVTDDAIYGTTQHIAGIRTDTKRLVESWWSDKWGGWYFNSFEGLPATPLKLFTSYTTREAGRSVIVHVVGVRDDTGALVEYRRSNTGSWTFSAVPLSADAGITSLIPAVISQNGVAQTQHLFALTSQGKLINYRWNASAGWQREDLTQRLTLPAFSAIAGAEDLQGSTLRLFGTAADGTLYEISFSSASGWTVGVVSSDPTAPTTPTVTDDGTYTASTTQLHAVWSSSDPESGIAEYQYAIGTTVGGTNVVNWTSTGTTAAVTKTGLSLTNGTSYYFSVKARNGAGSWSTAGNSDGITVDSTAPTTPAVTDDGVYTASATQLHATWTSSDSESGIAEYQYQITKDSPTGTVIVSWISTGTTASVTKTGLSLATGTSYHFSVKAKNGAGIWSLVGSSDRIKVDTSAPTTPVVTDDGIYTSSATQLHATWTSFDPESGIAEYQYAIGTTAGGTNIVNWTSTGTNTDVTHTGFTLIHGVTYYFSVRTLNGAGTRSAVGSSDGIVIDENAPAISGLTPTDGTAFTEGDLVTLTVTASDADADSLEYQYLIDGMVKQPWAPTSSWIWDTTSFPKTHTITAQVRDTHGRQAESRSKVFGYRSPPPLPTRR